MCYPVVPLAFRRVLTQEIKAISTNFRHNDQIRISPIRLVNDKEEQVGIVSTAEALRMAREAGLDLVEVAPTARPPVCRIMDYGKWRYQQQKKEDKSRASSRAGRLKQINIDTIRIGDHDLEIKINRAKDFLKEGNKVQFTLRFKGREMAHLDLGRGLFVKIKTELFLVSKVERDAKMEGKRMTLVLQPDHKDPSKIKPGEAQQSAQSQPQRAGSPLPLPPGLVRPGSGAPPSAPRISGAPVGAAVRPPGGTPRPPSAPTGASTTGSGAPPARPATSAPAGPTAATSSPRPAAPTPRPAPVPAEAST